MLSPESRSQQSLLALVLLETEALRAQMVSLAAIAMGCLEAS